MEQPGSSPDSGPLSFFMGNQHPGFQKVAQGIAKKGNMSFEEASAILASRTRNASAKAKKANPNLKKVK